jgi:tetratricopeptide (TPR) repeat protein
MAQMTAARMRIYSGDLDDAVAKSRQAVAVTARLKGSESPWLLQPKQALGVALSARLLLEPAEAEIRSELVLSTRLNGPEHIKTLTIMARLGVVLIETGRVAQGDAAHAEVRAVLAGKAQGTAAGDRPFIDGLMGQSLLDRGRPDLLLPILAADIDDMRRTLPRSGLLAHRLRSLALVQALQGDAAAARQTMAEASGLWRAYAAGTDAPAAEALFALGAAQVEIFSDAAAAALVWLESTRQLAPREAICVPLARARAWLALCRSSDAAREAATAFQALQALPEGYRPVAMDADGRLLMGQAHLQMGEAKAALPELTAALDLRLRHDDPASVWLADAQIALAECLVALGRREQASAMLNDAKRIHAQHPALGPHFASALKIALGAVENA